jgi:uncharacterized membrane protein YfcA
MEWWFLLGAAFVSSTISGVIGMGGGMLLLVAMAQVYPFEWLIPLHGFIQFSSNASRVVLHRPHVDSRVFLRFSLGAFIGVLIASPFAVRVDPNLYKIVLSVVILLVTFLRVPLPLGVKAFRWPMIGAFSSALAFYFGATGPFIAPFFLHEGLRKEALVATKASCQLLVHLFKTIAFLALGFSFFNEWKTLLAMILVVICGNIVGKQILGRISSIFFERAFKIMIVILCFRLIVSALLDLEII